MKYPDLGNSQRSTHICEEMETSTFRGIALRLTPPEDCAARVATSTDNNNNTPTPTHDPSQHIRLVRQDTSPVLHFEIPRLVEIGPPGCAGAPSRLQPGHAVPEDLEFPKAQYVWHPEVTYPLPTRALRSGKTLGRLCPPYIGPSPSLKQCNSCASYMYHSAFSTLFLARR